MKRPVLPMCAPAAIAFLFAILTTLGAAAPLQSEEPALDVVVFAGQSNMEGRDTAPKHLPARDKRGLEGTLVFDGEKWEPYTLHAGFGPELGFALQFKRVTGRPIGIIKLSKGGTSLQDEWSPGKRKGLYQSLVQVVERAQDQRKIRIIGMAWLQGEADARSSRAAKSYSRNLKALVRAAQKDFLAESALFIAGRVNPDLPPYSSVDVVRLGIERCGAKRYSWITCDNLSKNSDRLHYTSSAAVEIGRRMADELCSHMGEGRLDRASSKAAGEPIPFLFINVDALLRHRPSAVAAVEGLEGLLELLAFAADYRQLKELIEKAQTLVTAAEPSNRGERCSFEDIQAVLAELKRGASDLSKLPVHRRVLSEEKGETPELRGLPGAVYRR